MGFQKIPMVWPGLPSSLERTILNSERCLGYPGRCTFRMLGVWLASLCVVALGAHPHAGLDPVAAPEAIVVDPAGTTRFTVLTSRLIRMEYSASGVWEDAATFTVLNRRLPVPRFTSGVEAAVDSLGNSIQALTIRTEHLELL